MWRRWRWALLMVLAAYECARLPLPRIPGAYVSLQDVMLVLALVVFGGKLLYDTLFVPRGPWGRQP